MYTISDVALRRLLVVNAFPAPPAERMMFFGVRGCLPSDPEDTGFRAEVSLVTAEVNYTNPRCTLLQWRPAEKLVAAYCGSTVPHRRYVLSGLARGGAGVNQLLPGYYSDYRKGTHRPGTSRAHEAFRQTMNHPIQRTADDPDYDADDRVDLENPGDNLHAAWSQGLADCYSSAGCQVVIGFPSCRARGTAPSTGPWRAFRDAAYAQAQDRFAYALLEGLHVERIASNPSRQFSMRVRFGSEGEAVRGVQRALAERAMYEGAPDGIFGSRTLRAVLAFQREAFGPGSADGIVGPQTAAAMGIEWGTV